MATASTLKILESPTTGEFPQLAHDLALALDLVCLAEAAGYQLDRWQRNVVRSASRRQLLNCSRQSGKSLVSSIKAIHVTIYEPGALVLCLSPSLRQSSELFKKCLAIYRALGRPVSAESESALALTLENGSRIVSLPGKEATVRSYSGVRLLVVDEAARVPTDLYLSVRPMLAVSQGALIAASTPFGLRGWWADAWHSTEPWDRYEVTALDCPRIPSAFLEEEKRMLGEWWYTQEYMCKFLDAQTAAFRREDIDRAFSTEVETWNLL